VSNSWDSRENNTSLGLKNYGNNIIAQWSCTYSNNAGHWSQKLEFDKPLQLGFSATAETNVEHIVRIVS